MQLNDRKGFFFTTDAVLSLLLVLALGYSFFVYTQLPPEGAGKEAISFYTLGRDYMRESSSFDSFGTNAFSQLTGLSVTNNPPDPSQASVAVRSNYYYYANLCNCGNLTLCVVSETNPCVSGQDAVVTRESVWVYTR